MEETSSIYYVLPAGSTQEEELSREELKYRVEAGILSPDSFVFMRETKKWERIGDVDEFKDLLGDHGESSGDGFEDAGGSTTSGEKDEEYDRVLEEMRENGSSFDLLARAARIALNIGKRDEARSYYQRALLLKPFHPRIAREVKSGFSPSEQRSFELLNRKDPWWDDVMSFITGPFGGNWVRFAVLSLLFAAPLFSRWFFGLFFFFAFALEIELIRCHDSSHGVPPFNSRLPREALECLRAFSKSTVVWLECAAPFLVFASILSLLEHGAHFNPLAFIEKSPILVVLVYTVSLVYMPAVWIMSAEGRSSWRELLNPASVIRGIKLMETEYFVTVGLLGSVSLLWITLQGALGSVPLLGKMLAASLAVYFVWLTGFAFGRVRSRYRHVLFGSGAPGSAELEKVFRPED